MINARLLALIALLPVPCATAAEDWPKWLGPRGDNISKEEVAADWPSEGPKRLWAIDNVGGGHSSPVAREGKIYLFTLNGGEEVLACFDAKTGQVAWKQAYSIDRKPQYQGTRATPTIEGDRIYTFGESGDLVCRELADGKQVWRTNVLQETGGKLLPWGCASSPLIVGDRIFVQTGEGGPIAVSVDKRDGKVQWKSEARSKAGYATLVHADVEPKPQLIIFAGKAVGGLDPETGKSLWDDRFETQYDVNAATPVFHDGKVLVTAEYSNGRAALYELSEGRGTKVWESKSLKSKFQPVILEDGHVYGNSSGTLVCIKWEDGKSVWQAKGLNLGPGGSIVRAGGDKIITMSERGRLGLVRATPAGYEVLAQAPLFDGNQVWASPLVYDGKLYCKGMDELVCLDVSGK